MSDTVSSDVNRWATELFDQTIERHKRMIDDVNRWRGIAQADPVEQHKAAVPRFEREVSDVVRSWLAGGYGKDGGEKAMAEIQSLLESSDV